MLNSVSSASQEQERTHLEPFSSAKKNLQADFQKILRQAHLVAMN
jgi:hypothetical protein